MILAIDPGNIESAYVILDENYKPIKFDKVSNAKILFEISNYLQLKPLYIKGKVIIEMIASYGMSVGKSVFETCVWIGRFQQFALELGFEVEFIYRQEEKMNLCNSMKAKDSNIRQALIDRFAKFDFNSGKGTKKNQDWFYGFSKDVWAAYAVGVTYLDKIKGKV